MKQSIESRLLARMRDGNLPHRIPVVSRDGRAPLSFAQQRLWFLDQLEPDATEYVIPFGFQVTGHLDVAALETAVTMLVARHEVLRTRFIADEEGRPIQVADPARPFTLSRLDAPTDPESLRAVVAAEVGRPFDLAAEHPLRVTVLRQSPGRHVLLVVLHHIAADGWSAGILAGELDRCYTAATTGEDPALPDVGVQYADFAVWQRERLSGAALDSQLSYWTERLAGLEPLELPTDRPRPATRTGDGGGVSFALSPEVTAGLRAVAAAQGGSLFMACLAVFQVLLSRYTRQTDIAVGTPIAGRNHTDIENLVGFFVNTLVMRTDLTDDPTVEQLVTRIRDHSLDAYTHQDLPFEKLVEQLTPDRDLSRNPLFQTMFVLQSAATGGGDVGGTGNETWRLTGCELTPIPVSTGTTKFDLTLTLVEDGDGLTGHFAYATDLFEAATIARMAEHFRNLARAFGSSPSTRTDALDMCSADERELLLDTWNDTVFAHPEHLSIDRLVKQRATEQPDAVAVVDGDTSLTYAALDESADRLAHHLVQAGAGHEVPVGVHLPRGADFITTVLAVLKTGGAYVPLDLDYPPDRLAHMLDDSGAPVVVTTSGLVDALPATTATPVVLDALPTDDGPATPPPAVAAPDTLAYIVYTSGSTGTPKGVQIPHRAVNRLVHNDYAEIGPGDVVAQASNGAFDAFTWECWAALVHGATIAVIDKDTVVDTPALKAALRGHGVTAMFLTAALFHQHLSDDPGVFDGLNTVLYGGEAVDRGTADRLAARGGSAPTVVHVYGPTETTTFATAYRVTPGRHETTATQPIGSPIRNTTAYVVDSRMRPTGTGVAGELLIGGPGVARGYRGRPELTAERFVDNPFGPGVLYRTGDLVKRLPDGEIEFLGRMDQQVKLRGHRIEPGEIETALLADPAISAATVVVREDDPGDKRLVAYLVTDAPPDTTTVRARLRNSLPDYMIPAAFVRIESIPLTPNGKIDRGRLPAPEAGRDGDADRHVPPATPTQALVARVWSEVLRRDEIGAYDDFFTLGGHSLLATQAVSRLRRTLGTEVTVRDLFGNPTVASLAAVLDAAGSATTSAIPTADRGDGLPLSFAQQRLWFLDQLYPGGAEYLVPFAMRVSGDLDVAALEAAVSTIVARHEVLRTRFVADEHGRPAQVIDPPARVTAEFTDLSAEPDGRRRAEQVIADRARTGFDLAGEPPLRLSVVRVSDGEHLVLLVMHHIVSDGWSVGVLATELEAAYRAVSSGDEAGLPALPVQYADFAAWQRDHLTGDLLDRQLSYWTERLAGLEPLELPTDRPRPAERSGDGDTVDFTLPEETTTALRDLASRHDASLFMTTLAVFQVLLSRYTRQTDIAVGTPIAGRNHTDIENLVGFFVNTLVMRTDLTDDPTVEQLVTRIRDHSLDAYTHQDLPFEKLVEQLTPDRDLSRNPLFQTMFVLHNGGSGTGWRLPGCDVEPFSPHSGKTKFDLTLTMSDDGDRLTGQFAYATDLFDRSTVERMARHLGNLAAALGSAPAHRRVGRLTMIDADERAAVVSEWNRAEADFPADKTIHRLIEERARAVPDAVAVRYGDEEWTYRELNARANQLAHRLREGGAGPGDLVAVCLEHSPDAVISLLAVLKAGAAFVPLDPSYPMARLEFMLADTEAPVVITTCDIARGLPATGADVITLDTEWPRLREVSTDDPPATAGPADLAYVIYTSGSTGRPKGVMLEHHGVVNYLHWCDTAYPARGDVGTFLYSSITFDLTITALFLPLIQGGSIAIPVPAPGATAFQATVERLLEGVEVGFLKATPSHLELLVTLAEQGGNRLRIHSIVAGGEELTSALARRIIAVSDVDVTITNEYGATEGSVANVMSATTIRTPLDRKAVHCGRAIQNTKVYIVDEYDRPVPPGVPGEALLGGVCVARGYHRRPDLTSRRFTPDPFGPGRVYRTGDLAVWLPDGHLEFVGRIDDQVKLRGYRIELGEIEAALRDRPGVTAAAVVVRQDSPGEKRLVGYVTGTDAPDTTTLHAALTRRLPEYMVPTALVRLDSLPLTPNGKVDTKALPAPKGALERPGDDHEPPTTPAEIAIAQIWGELLRVERVGVHDNFFELGGDSILSIQVIARAKRYGLHLTPRMVFQHQTVAALAANALPAGTIRAEQGRVTGDVPLTPVQHWFFDTDRAEPHHFNQSVLLETDGLEPDVLERALRSVADHHDVLRMRFQSGRDGVRQFHADDVGDAVVIHRDLSGLDVAATTAAITEEFAGAQRGLRLLDGPLVRAVLVDVGARGQRLLLTVHHLVVDGVSWRILLEDLGFAYSQSARGVRPVFPVKTTSFREWSLRLRELATSPKAVEELGYWARPRASGRLPRDRDGENTLQSRRVVTANLTPSETDALLRDVPRAFGSQINDALLTALAVTVREWTGDDALSVSLEGHGREDLFADVDLSRTVGWFTSMFPVELRTDPAADLPETLISIGDRLAEIPNHGIGYGLLRHLGDESTREALAAVPEPQIIFNYLGQFAPHVPGMGRYADPGESRGGAMSPLGRRGHVLEVNSDIRDGRFGVDFAYSAELHDESTIRRLADRMLAVLRDVIAGATEITAGIAPTPQDFPLARIDDDDLAAILERFSQ
ncbi:amino acid adenylation domain-containing protein [Stackebrandtia albiflava]|uniref:amino acid adenylation domain-containing protein n=1 Tax=Stackebrandtia albiflava TaxID=406432 RepID=UPI0031EF4A5B